MNQMTDLNFVRRTSALETLSAKLREDMKRRWPGIDFDADTWPIKTSYQTKMVNLKFGATIAAFAGCDSAYLLALRCLLASAALEGNRATWVGLEQAWRLLAANLGATTPLAALQRHHLQDLEEKACRETTPLSAGRLRVNLITLANHLDYLSRQGVVERFMWRPSVETKAKLRKSAQASSKAYKQGKAEVLDRQIEAFSEVTAAMLKGDDRLDQVDRSCIALTNILMCAPSRINEVLCLKFGDRFTIEDYARRSENREQDSLHRAHQLLLIKGSKGAAWSGKPILNFMIELVEQCWQILLDGGKRSRMLVSWYEKHPDQLYLPPGLEHLRGKPVTSELLWQIVMLTTEKPSQGQLCAVRNNYWYKIVKPRDKQASALTVVDNPRRALHWWAVEEYLLKQVHERMGRMRRVTVLVDYKGRLSEMLVLVDCNYTPYLPDALYDQKVRSRLRTSRADLPSVFSKLDLRMSQDGKEVQCYLGTHDPRRWLTTQALSAGEKLSDVMINKWARRLNVRQMDGYDLREDEQKADQAAMSLPNELADMSNGLQALEDQSAQYGLSSEIVVAHGQGVSVTSMEAVCQATEDRPVARTGGQILILYPTRFGVCVHQHHETPCRSYKCAPCNENTAVKGHLPTNDEWRKENDLAYRGIVNQLQALITARNRGIADDPEMFDAHLMTLVKEGLDPQTMANELIDRFHEIKDQIRELSFRNELEQAFVARGVAKRLDDPKVANGALIKYHNPKRHAAPGHELAIEAHFGSREEMNRQSDLFYQQHPELAPANLGLQDERHLLGEDDDGVEDDQAA